MGSSCNRGGGCHGVTATEAFRRSRRETPWGHHNSSRSPEAQDQVDSAAARPRGRAGGAGGAAATGRMRSSWSPHSGRSVCGQATQRSECFIFNSEALSLVGELGLPQFFGHRLRTSMPVRQWMTARQAWSKPSVQRRLLVGGFVLPCRLGDAHESLNLRLEYFRRVSCSEADPIPGDPRALGGAECGEQGRHD